MRLLGAIAVVALAGCGSESSESAVAAHDAILLDSLDPAAGDREVVAQVNGKPIYADCVAGQAQAHALDRAAALQECIDFELLAQAADAPKYLEDPAVQEAGKQQLVRAYLADRYALRGPADFGDELVRGLWERISVPRYNHPELRNIVFCKIPLTEEMGPRSPAYQTAKSFFAMLYEELGARDDLEQNDLFAACYDRYESYGVHDLTLSTFRLAPRQSHHEAWREPVFAGQAGQVLPPIVDATGMTFILITEAKDALETSFEEAEPELREALYSVSVYQTQRNELFQSWFKDIAASYKIQRFPERVPAAEPVVSVGDTRPSP